MRDVYALIFAPLNSLSFISLWMIIKPNQDKGVVPPPFDQ